MIVGVRVGVGVAVYVGVRLGLLVWVTVGVDVGVLVAVVVDVSVGVGVGVLVGVTVAVSVGVGVGVEVGVWVGVGVRVAVTVWDCVGVRVGVTVGVTVGDGVGVNDGVGVGLKVGVGVYGTHSAVRPLQSAFGTGQQVGSSKPQVPGINSTPHDRKMPSLHWQQTLWAITAVPFRTIVRMKNTSDTNAGILLMILHPSARVTREKRAI